MHSRCHQISCFWKELTGHQFSKVPKLIRELFCCLMRNLLGKQKIASCLSKECAREYMMVFSCLETLVGPFSFKNSCDRMTSSKRPVSLSRVLCVSNAYHITGLVGLFGFTCLLQMGRVSEHFKIWSVFEEYLCDHSVNSVPLHCHLACRASPAFLCPLKRNLVCEVGMQKNPGKHSNIAAT